MTTESLNVEAAKKAMGNATIEIEELIKKFWQTEKIVNESFSQNNSNMEALGGNLGAAAQNAFMQGSLESFNDLKNKIDNFINVRVEQIIATNENLVDAVQATYSKM